MALYYDTLSGTYGDTTSLYIMDDELTDAVVHIADTMSHREAMIVVRHAGVPLADILEGK